MRTPQPDRAALEIAHARLNTGTTLDEALRKPALKALIKARAKKHMRERDRVDFKKLQSGDND